MRKATARTPGAAHTVVLSDIHLWQAVRAQGLWMRYRDASLFPDEELAGLLSQLRTSACGGRLEVVFAGDIFDFDVPFVKDGVSDPDIKCLDEPSAVRFMEAILDDHPVFLRALAELLHEGHRAVFLCGNHDLQLALESVREVLRRRVVEAAVQSNGLLDVDALLARLEFRAWFHRTEAGVLVEHGSQYDRYCSVPYPMQPLLEASGTVTPTMGSLAMRELIAKLGYFNPNVDSSYLLTARGYLQHWIRYYLFQEHSLVRTWLFGSLRVALGVLAAPRRQSPAQAATELRLAGAESGCSPEVLERHRAAFLSPDLGRTARLLGIDALGLYVGLLLALTVALALHEPLLGLGLALLTVLAAVLFRVRVGDCSLDEGYAGIREAMHTLAEVHQVEAVVFGHTHLSGGEWDDRGMFYGNSGTWSPTFADVACTVPLHRGRPLVWLWRDQELRGGEFRYIEGRIEPVSVRALRTEGASTAPASAGRRQVA